MRKEPCYLLKEHADMGTRTSHCCLCGEKVGLTVEEIVAEGIALIPVETKQKFMDLIKTGMKLGEATQQAGIGDYKGLSASMLSAKIVVNQIEHIKVLSFEVKG